MTLFHVGMMVVAVGSDEATEAFKAKGGIHPRRVTYPTRGYIYTIRGIRPCDDGHAGIVVEEIVNPIGPAGFEWDFDSRCFRPCRKTDISALRELIAPKPKVEA